MPKSKQNRVADEQNRDRSARPLQVTAALKMTVDDMVIRATADTATDSYTITLPNVTEARGRTYSIHATIANAKAITLQDNDESDDFDGDYTLDTDNDGILLYSDGIMWWELQNRIV